MHGGGSGAKEKPPPAAAPQTNQDHASLNIIFKQFHHCRPGSELGNCCLFLTDWDLYQGGFCSRLEVFSLAAFEIPERSNVYLMGRREAQSSCDAVSFHLQNITKIQAKNPEQEQEFLRQLCSHSFKNKIG